MEDDFFLKKMKGVKPFKKDSIKTKIKNIKKKGSKINKKNDTNINIKEVASGSKKHNTDFSLSFGDINRELKRGKVKIDRRLDLHGYSLAEAQNKFKNEIQKNYNKNKRCLLIITGKGAHKKDKKEEEEHPKLFYGKIKNSIISWINEEDLKKYVLTYQDAGIEHGGDGAIFVYLRKKKF
tara:strand:+ start:275 stop:814 length:540 start_codon:yes stop_codon:yes gene_type:complete